MTLRVRLLGHPHVEDATGQPGRPARGQKSWALLARVVLAERPLTRSELAAELFAEADDPLGALRWCLADLRRCCQDPRLLRGDPVSLAGSSLWFDVLALRDGSLPAAEIGGTLLEGVEPRNCPAFGVWLMMARAAVGPVDGGTAPRGAVVADHGRRGGGHRAGRTRGRARSAR